MRARGRTIKSMDTLYLRRFTLADPLHGQVPCVELAPARSLAPSLARSNDGSLPVCLFLYGGGGNAEMLAGLGPVLDEMTKNGVLPAMRIVCPEVGPYSFYLDDPARGLGWETFVAERLVDHCTAGLVGAVGISMGGYGALKMAFARPARFRAAAAISPMIEPSLRARDTPLRNRFHYPPEVPVALLGRERDEALYAADHPGCRAQANAESIAAQALAIYIDAGGDDLLHAHDGAEFLHRILWDLDIAHEYRLLADADHVGPTILRRIQTAFTWVGERLVPRMAELSDIELAWTAWIDGGSQGESPAEPLPPTSAVFARVLRAMLGPAAREAAARDPTFHRRYGVLPRREA